MATEQIDATHENPETHALQCMEIWGGNRAIDSAISTTGIDAWIYSEPFESGVGGGDIHYVSMCASGRIARFVVADVSGHGEGVSELAATLRRQMRRHINRVDQASFARALNEAFRRLAEVGQFATALLASYDAPTNHLIVCNAGHPRPLLRRAGETTWTLLDRHAGCAVIDHGGGESGLPLGVVEDTDYFQFAVPLKPGDLVLIYTDAMIEAKGEDGRLLGEDGFRTLLDGVSPQADAVIPEALERLNRVRRGVAADDDVTALLLHHNGGSPPSLSFAERARVIGRLIGLGGD